MSMASTCSAMRLPANPMASSVIAVKAGKSVHRATLADLIDSLLKAEREGRLTGKIRFYSRVWPLIVDEIGYLPIAAAGLFFQLVDARFKKRSTVLTSNRRFSKWGDVFGDPVVATALLGRLLHRTGVTQIEGAGNRLRSHADLIPERARAAASVTPPQPKRKRGLPRKKEQTDA